MPDLIVSHEFKSGTVAYASSVNADLDDLYLWFNGGIFAENIDPTTALAAGNIQISANIVSSQTSMENVLYNFIEDRSPFTLSNPVISICHDSNCRNAIITFSAKCVGFFSACGGYGVVTDCCDTVRIGSGGFNFGVTHGTTRSTIASLPIYLFGVSVSGSMKLALGRWDVSTFLCAANFASAGPISCSQLFMNSVSVLDATSNFMVRCLAKLTCTVSVSGSGPSSFVFKSWEQEHISNPQALYYATAAQAIDSTGSQAIYMTHAKFDTHNMSDIGATCFAYVIHTPGFYRVIYHANLVQGANSDVWTAVVCTAKIKLNATSVATVIHGKAFTVPVYHVGYFNSGDKVTFSITTNETGTAGLTTWPGGHKGMFVPQSAYIGRIGP